MQFSRSPSQSEDTGVHVPSLFKGNGEGLAFTLTSAKACVTNRILAFKRDLHITKT